MLWNTGFVIVKISRNRFGDYVRWCWVLYSQTNRQDQAIALVRLELRDTHLILNDILGASILHQKLLVTLNPHCLEVLAFAS